MVPVSALLGTEDLVANLLFLAPTTALRTVFATDRSAFATQAGLDTTAAIKHVALTLALIVGSVGTVSAIAILLSEVLLASSSLSVLTNATSAVFAFMTDAFASQASAEMIAAKNFSVARITALAMEFADLESAIATPDLRERLASHKLFALTIALTTEFALTVAASARFSEDLIAVTDLPARTSAVETVFATKESASVMLDSLGWTAQKNSLAPTTATEMVSASEASANATPDFLVLIAATCLSAIQAATITEFANMESASVILDSMGTAATRCSSARDDATP